MIVSDFLSLDAENFEQQYDRNELYEKDILYCDQNAWKYDGNAVDPYQKPEDRRFTRKEWTAKAEKKCWI